MKNVNSKIYLDVTNKILAIYSYTSHRYTTQYHTPGLIGKQNIFSNIFEQFRYAISLTFSENIFI